MGIQQLVGLIKANLEFLPSWFLAIFWHLVAAIFVVYLLTILFKALSDTAFTTPVKSIGSFTASILRSLLRGGIQGNSIAHRAPKDEARGQDPSTYTFVSWLCDLLRVDALCRLPHGRGLAGPRLAHAVKCFRLALPVLLSHSVLPSRG